MEDDHGSPLNGALTTQATYAQDMEVEMEMMAGNHHFEEEANPKGHEQYLQNEPISGKDVNDWVNLPELPSRQLGEFQSVANIYRSSFTILSREWGCSPATCLPAELRLQTPYSLALVVRLAELALLTRGCMHAAHEKLSALSQESSVAIDVQAGWINTIELARGMAHKRYTEFKVIERFEGLMIGDVEKAKAYFTATPPRQELVAQAASRADRAMRRSRSQSGVPGHETELQQRDWDHEKHVGGGLGKKLKLRHRQLQQRPERGSEKSRKRQAREAILVMHVLNEDTPTAEREHMRQANGDRAKDSTCAPPNSPQQQASEVHKSKPRKNSRSKKMRVRIVDRYMARIFDDISIEQDGLEQPQQAIREPPGLNRLTPQRSGPPALPFERSAISLSPSLLELQGSMTGTMSNPLARPVLNAAQHVRADEGL